MSENLDHQSAALRVEQADKVYHGATGYTDAEAAEQMLQASGLTTSFRQELDGAWSVRLGPLPREQMRAMLEHFVW